MVFITQFSNNSLASKGFKKLFTVINFIIEDKFKIIRMKSIIRQFHTDAQSIWFSLSSLSQRWITIIIIKMQFYSWFTAPLNDHDWHWLIKNCLVHQLRLINPVIVLAPTFLDDVLRSKCSLHSIWRTRLNAFL